MPRVSILLTCYNHLKYLPDCLESVRKQTFQDYEVIALDDGSTDSTREWLTQQEDVRRIFNEKNLGTYATLNVGLENASGEYIAVLNDDDLWAPEKLARQVEVLDNSPKVGFVHTGGWFIDGEGKRIADPEPLGFPFPRTITGDLYPTLIDHNQMITSSLLVRGEAFEKCGPFDPEFYGCGDWQMWLRLAKHYDGAFVDADLTFYRVHGANAFLNTEKMNADSRRIREWLALEESNNDLNREGLADAFAHNWACLGTERAWNGDMAGARGAYKQAIKRRPERWKTYIRYLATFGGRKLFRRLN